MTGEAVVAGVAVVAVVAVAVVAVAVDVAYRGQQSFLVDPTLWQWSKTRFGSQCSLIFSSLG